MVDIHQHLVPGVDDGATDPENSVEMARLAVADGITHVSCSPHANSKYPYDRERYEVKVQELREHLALEHIPLTLGLGSDFHMSYDNVQDALAHPDRYTINRLGYLLIELPDFALPRGLNETFYQLRVAGMIPILTHPERNPTLQTDMPRIADWLRAGMLIQVTAGSVVGQMGKPAQKTALKLLANRWVNFIATDGHNTTSRPPNMSAAYKLVEKKFGKDYAHAICVENPLAAFEGRQLPPQIEPKHLFEDNVGRSWLDRLLRR